MAISTVPEASFPTTPEFSIPIRFSPQTTAYTEYVYAIEAGVYNVVTNTSTATIMFYSGSTVLTTINASTSNTEVNLASAANAVAVIAGVSGGITVTITRTLRPLASTSYSGTLYTITSSSANYAIPSSALGKQYVMCVGGGAGGGPGSPNVSWAGSGGGSGAVVTGATQLSGNISVTIGAKGNGPYPGNVGNNGGSTSWGNFVIAPGGTGGNNSENTGIRSGGAGGSPNGGSGGSVSENANVGGAGSASTTPANLGWINNGTTGGGGGGVRTWVGGTAGGGGGGSGIGTGGAGGQNGSTNGKSANGYGAGGGGGGGGAQGGPGSDGVIYLICV